MNIAYVPVPKDLTRVKSKFLFNLTKRQVVCFGLGALVGLPVFFLTKEAIGVSMAAALMIVIMLPFFLFAMFERNGQPLEVLLKHYMRRLSQMIPRTVATKGADSARIRQNHRARALAFRGLGRSLPTSYLQFGPDCIACHHSPIFTRITVLFIKHFNIEIVLLLY